MSNKRSLTLTEALIVIGFCFLLIVLSPVLVPLLVYGYAKNEFEQARLRRFLARSDGAKFFCYTSKATGLKFARENILPNLEQDIQIIFMSEKGRINLGDESLLNTLIGMEAGGAKRGGYPCVAKVVKGRLVSKSLNTEFYRTIARHSDPEKLIEDIRKFYETTD